METNLPVIYGIVDNQSQFGLQAFALDPQDETILASHFCSDVSWAQSDLGFDGSETHFAQERNKIYSEKYPNGYKLEWMGNWNNSVHLSEMLERAYQKKYPTIETPEKEH
jgi:hypothetical protein